MRADLPDDIRVTQYIKETVDYEKRRYAKMNSKPTEMSLDLSLRPVYADNIYDLVTWCRDYGRRNKFRYDVKTGFGIGFYQIHQGMEWKDNGINKYEGYAAAVIHFIVVSEMCGLSIDVPDYVELKLKDFPTYEMQYKAYDLLKNLSKAQQHIYYSTKHKNIKRAFRYSAEKLTNALAQSVLILISCIPIELRSDAFDAATAIMTGDLK